MKLIIPAVFLLLLLFSSSQAQFTGGSGEDTDPYQIATVEQLQEIRNHLEAHFIQIADIDASETEDWNDGMGFLPLTNTEGFFNDIVPFTGSYEGNGHKISSLFIVRSDEEYVGLFGFADSSSSIKNVSLENITVEGSSYVGGLIGHNAGFVYGSTISGSVSGFHRIGGLIGKNIGNIKSSGFNGTVSASLYAGGLIAENNGGVISESYASGFLSGFGEIMAGLVGYNKGDIINSYSEVEVSGRRYVAGLIGIHHAGEVSGCYATGDISSEWAYSGGLIGLNNSEVINSYARGDVSDNRNYTGGLAGWNSGIIQSSFATGNVAGESEAGGLAGGNSGIIQSSYATGNVTAGSDAGGLAGINTDNGEIRHSYSVGAVTGNEIVGGLVGTNSENGMIYESYSAGLVTGNDAVGGLAGINASIIAECFWDMESSEKDQSVGKLSSQGITGLSTTEMTGVAAYESMSTFDFDEFWLLTKGYPSLHWEDVATLPIPTSVDEISAYPAAFVLSQNYPNPFNPSTQIRFALPEQSHVQLTVYNLLGQKVAALVNGFRSPGWHEVSFDASHLSSGLYLYRLQTGEFIENKQMLLTK